MYVLTFYSFKGGVGRSMALVNVAAQLAKEGRRVLMVDFDLEAPGLSSFNLLHAQRQHPGIVEFVTHYLMHQETPDVSEYVFESNAFPDSGGSLLIMPAGRQDDSYQSRFGEINWQELYERRDGFLLMEDLRLQWKEAFNPDYVFIDSRTGYTDIAGICTRQLPDAVCLLFTPNRQNLAGMSNITAEINSQKNTPSLRQPKLHFVASNVPNLDDDEKLLAKALDGFSTKLGYVKPAAVIQHYNSFSLLDEVVFTLEYPKSQLAKQYRSLANELTKDNFQDKISAINYLKSVIRDYLEGEGNHTAKEVGARLTDIEASLGTDRDVLYWLSRLRKSFGNLEESRLLLDQAIMKGLSTSRAYLDRAILKINEDKDNKEEIVSDIRKIFSLQQGGSATELHTAIRLALKYGQNKSEFFTESPAIGSLPVEDFLFLLNLLEDTKESLLLATALVKDAILKRNMSPNERKICLGNLGKYYIGLGMLKHAVETLQDAGKIVGEASLPSEFNLGMARFWLGESEVKHVFYSVLIQIEKDKQNEQSFNMVQCSSFCRWIIGDTQGALSALDRAKKLLTEKQQHRSYSCWRYLVVQPEALYEDLSEMEKLFNGEEITPIFLRQSDELFLS